MLAHLRPLALLLSVSLVMGCAVGPDYRSPEMDAPSRFLGQEGYARRDVQSKADLNAWWAGFDDPLLTRFISRALEQNLDIAQAAARVAQSRASLRQADAALLPSADVRANAARAYQSVETPLGQLLNATPDFDRNVSYAQVEAQIPALEAGLDSAMNALYVLLAVQPGTYRAELSAAPSIPVAPGLAETGTPAEMIRRRPDLMLAERRLADASARIGVAVSEYYPKFSLGGLLGSATAISIGNLFTGGASNCLVPGFGGRMGCPTCKQQPPLQQPFHY